MPSYGARLCGSPCPFTGQKQQQYPEPLVAASRFLHFFNQRDRLSQRAQIFFLYILCIWGAGGKNPASKSSSVERLTAGATASHLQGLVLQGDYSLLESIHLSLSSAVAAQVDTACPWSRRVGFQPFPLFLILLLLSAKSQCFYSLRVSLNQSQLLLHQDYKNPLSPHSNRTNTPMQWCFPR